MDEPRPGCLLNKSSLASGSSPQAAWSNQHYRRAMGVCGCHHCRQMRGESEMADPGEGSPFRPAARILADRNHATRVEARRRWKRAYYRIRTLIRARLKWHRLGLYLQAEEIQDLFLGLERCRGVLVRKTSATQAKQRSRHSRSR